MTESTTPVVTSVLSLSRPSVRPSLEDWLAKNHRKIKTVSDLYRVSKARIWFHVCVYVRVIWEFFQNFSSKRFLAYKYQISRASAALSNRAFERHCMRERLKVHLIIIHSKLDIRDLKGMTKFIPYGQPLYVYLVCLS